MSARRGLWCASLVLLSSGCGLFSAQAEAPAASSAPTRSTASTTPSATTPTPAPAGSTAALVDSVDGRPARLSVTAGPVLPGLAPVLAADGSGACGLADGGAEYAEVTVVFTVPDQPSKEHPVTANLRLELSVPDGDGVFLETDDPSTECAGGAGLPAQATLQTLYLAAEHQTIRVYVVARTGGLQGVNLRLQNLRFHPDSTGGSERTWTVGHVTVGTTCEGDPNSLCVPLA